MKRISIFALLVTLLACTSCAILKSYIVEPQVYGFKTKEEVIKAVKDNIDSLNEIVNEIRERENDKEFFSIEKSNSKKKFDDSMVLDIDNLDRLFEILKINCIYADEYGKNIQFNVNFYTFSNYCGFYYSYDDNANSDNKYWKDEYPFIHKDNWTFLFGKRYGWYTEKICDNWYYYENYEGPRKVIGYIEDDLKEMGYYNRIMKEIEEYEEKSNVYRKNKSENNS